jgi:alkylation response protein AidB-like acyl-CoA dehydrogenase
MHLTPDPDQEALRIASADWCAANIPLADARMRGGNLRAQMDAMGWIGMTAPAMALDHASEALVFAELGRFLAPVGTLAGAVAARWSDDKRTFALAVPGNAVIRVLDPTGASAALGMWNGMVGLLAVPDGIEIRPGIDLTTSQALISVDQPPHIINDSRAAAHFQLLAAAYAVGCADAARDMASGYALLREQFERPIGWFQAIKHLCADMAVRCAVARSQLYYAAAALDAGDDETMFHVRAAKQLADTAALENGRANIQIHGGIGMTDEATPHLCLKRAHLLGFIAPVTTADLLASAIDR